MNVLLEIPFYIYLWILVFLLEFYSYFTNNKFLNFKFNDLLVSFLIIVLQFNCEQVLAEKIELKNQNQILESKIQLMQLKK